MQLQAQSRHGSSFSGRILARSPSNRLLDQADLPIDRCAKHAQVSGLDAIGRQGTGGMGCPQGQFVEMAGLVGGQHPETDHRVHERGVDGCRLGEFGSGQS